MGSCIKCRGNKIREVVKENKRYFFCDDCQKLYEQINDTKTGKIAFMNFGDGVLRHVTAGALVKKDAHFLLLKRRSFPYGYDFPAGHVYYNEKPEQTIKRELLEETGLKVKSCSLMFNTIVDSKCKYG